MKRKLLAMLWVLLVIQSLFRTSPLECGKQPEVIDIPKASHKPERIRLAPFKVNGAILTLEDCLRVPTFVISEGQPSSRP